MPEDEELLPDHLKALLAKIDPAVLQQVMPLTGGVITMMFTDIVDSTKLTAEVGDQAYFEVRERHNELIRQCIAAHNGRELKTIGDAFLVGFAIPANAVDCALGIQQRLIESPIPVGQGFLQVRIGLHTGTPIVYRDTVSKLIDLSGTDVNTAARVEGLAGGGQILISEETRTMAKPKGVHDWGQWELKGLGRLRIFEVLWTGKAPERPSGRAWLEASRFPTRFIGRDAEITTIMDAVLKHRLVTLKGMGGIGKTRLADEVAARVSQHFEDGVLFAELANIRDSKESVVSELIMKLDLRPAGFPDEATALLESLRNRRLLLVLDNFEAVMSVAPFADQLLRQCPGLRLLVTSQRLIGVTGERQIEVQPMAAPAALSATAETLRQLDSFELFLDRARLKKSGWDPSQRETQLVAEILDLTDGIPLSIEMAAAWADRVAFPELRDGLKHNRFEYLKRAGPGAEEKRHASVKACVEWSFNLVSEQEKALLPKVCVFVGGFFADDVAQVCQMENASALLRSLQELSFLSWSESMGKTRYRMLPTVREYAAEKCGDQMAEFQMEHAKHFLKILDRADDQIRGKEQMAGIDRITADIENIRAGLETMLETREHRLVVRYCNAFETYLRMKAAFAELLLRDQQGLLAAEALKDGLLVAGCQNNLGLAYAELPTGDRGANLQRAIECFEAALRVYTERDFPVQWAATQNNLGIAYRNLLTGDRGANLQRAIGCFEAALRVYTERDFPVDWATAQNNLGVAYGDLPTGDRGENLQRAIGCYEAALRGYKAAGLTEKVNLVERLLLSLRKEKSDE